MINILMEVFGALTIRIDALDLSYPKEHPSGFPVNVYGVLMYEC